MLWIFLGGGGIPKMYVYFVRDSLSLIFKLKKIAKSAKKKKLISTENAIMLSQDLSGL